MGKGKNRKQRDDASASSGKKKEKTKEPEIAPTTEAKAKVPATKSTAKERSLLERQGAAWLLGSLFVVGLLIGLNHVSWRLRLGSKISSAHVFQKYVQMNSLRGLSHLLFVVVVVGYYHFEVLVQ